MTSSIKDLTSDQRQYLSDLSDQDRKELLRFREENGRWPSQVEWGLDQFNSDRYRQAFLKRVAR